LVKYKQVRNGFFFLKLYNFIDLIKKIKTDKKNRPKTIEKKEEKN